MTIASWPTCSFCFLPSVTGHVPLKIHWPRVQSAIILLSKLGHPDNLPLTSSYILRVAMFFNSMISFFRSVLILFLFTYRIVYENYTIVSEFTK